MIAKPIDSVTYAEWKRHAVWKFVAEASTRDETCVTPVAKVPVKSLSGRLLSIKIRFANGQEACGVLGNIDLENPELNQHFLSLSIVREDGAMFHLARYHDPDFDSNGPNALARFLGLTVAELFPISYCIESSVVQGATGLEARILAVPEKKLTRAQIIALAVP
jgi:hypothetical protein